jgi:uncharacterized protein (TIGR02246 family)
MTSSSDEAKAAARTIVENWGKAFTNADVDGIACLYAPDALMIGTMGTAVLTKPEQIRHYFDVALNANRPRTATLNSSEVLVIDDTTVVVTGFDTVTSTKDGQQIVGKGRVTFVVSKRNNTWSIAHLHRSPLPAT